LSGLGLAVAAAIALAFVFPPTLFLPPAVEPGQLLAPPAPGAPGRLADPDRPRGADQPGRQATLPVASPPAVQDALGIDPVAPLPTPAVFGGRPEAALPVQAAPAVGPGPDIPADIVAVDASPGAVPALAGLPAPEAAPAVGGAFTPPPTPRVIGGDAGAPMATPGATERAAFPGGAGAAVAVAAAPMLAGRPDVEVVERAGAFAPPPAPGPVDLAPGTPLATPQVLTQALVPQPLPQLRPRPRPRPGAGAPGQAPALAEPPEIVVSAGLEAVAPPPTPTVLDGAPVLAVPVAE
jgi:hypothetical protein